MGYEAYNITAKVLDLPMEDVKDALARCGARQTEEFGGTATMVVSRPNGLIELILREENHVNLRFSPQEQVRLTVRFAKTSRVQLVGDVLCLLKELAGACQVAYIRDRQTGREIDPDNAGWLYQTVSYAKYDFEYNFPGGRTGVCCRSIFCPERRVWPTAV